MDHSFPLSPFDPPAGSMPYAGIATFAGYPFWQSGRVADAVVLGIPYAEGTSCRPGTHFGPRSIRDASQFYNYDK
nr:arginase family protein [Deltaproteobacteria bacterium]